jgi:hypothetical protein
MIDLFFFAAETPAKKNTHSLPARQYSTKRAYAKREFFPFSVLSPEKGKNLFLCDLCASSEAGGEK